MKKSDSSFAIWLLTVLLVTTLLAGYTGQVAAQHAADPTPVTIITVNSGTDPDTSDSRTCLTYTPCTLRRAVIQARNLPANQKPVRIAFNIPATSAEGYNSSLQIWKIQFSGISSTTNAALRYLNGDIIIDGTTQPGGRTNGPKIILVGPGTGQWDGLKLGETQLQNNNIIRGFAFQNFKTHIYINSSTNLIEENWFGLSDDGMDIVLRGGGEDDGSGNTGVSVSANSTNNIITDNVFSGLAGVAAAINGDSGTFSQNYIGTIKNGTVPDKATDPNLICSQWDWLGGSGISVSGSYNLVENNIFAGIRIAVDPPTIQADTIRLSGDHHIIRDNKIGLDINNVQVGVCGRGIYLQGGSKYDQITRNRIYLPGLSAISLNDTPVVSTTDANTFRGNIIKKNTPWGEIEGNNSPEDAIQITKSLPDAFRNFNPAKISNVEGTLVTGTNGTNSPCPNCVIELFLEDSDSINEALQSLAVVNANSSGNWSVTLASELNDGQGLRTTSTTTQHNTIPGFSSGTTTGLSTLYVINTTYEVFIPMVVR